jgi:hypothetical protein
MVIGGVVVAVGITQYQDADRAAQIQSTVAEVNSIIGNAKQNYGQYAYAGLNTAAAVGSRVIPPNLHTGAATATNKFGGVIALDEVVGTGTASLTYPNVPANVCTAIINGTQGLAEQVSAGAGAAAIKAAGGAVDVAVLNASCTSGVSVNIVWTFGRT